MQSGCHLLRTVCVATSDTIAKFGPLFCQLISRKSSRSVSSFFLLLLFFCSRYCSQTKASYLTRKSLRQTCN